MRSAFVRPIIASFAYQVRVNVTTLSSVLIFIFTPIIFGAVSVLFLKPYQADDLMRRAVLGSCIVAVWTTSLMLSNITLGAERWSGVIELMLATPARMGTVIVGKLLANAAQGVLAAALALTVITVIHPTGISLDRPMLFLGSALLAVIAIGALAFAWSPVLFLSRNATNLFFVLDTSLVFVSAVFFPVSRLPEWLQPVSKLSPLRWASESLFRSTDSTSQSSETYAIWMALGTLACLYIAVGLVGFGLLERRLRRTGELSTF